MAAKETAAMNDACESTLSALDKVLTSQANAQTLSIEKLENEALPLLKQIKESRCMDSAERCNQMDTVIAMIETTIKILHKKRSINERREGDEFDPFAEARKLAVERTIISDASLLPHLDDLVGLTEAKQTLREALLDPLTYPEWFTSSDLKPWRCVLLYGPPGTGKTQLSQAVAREINSRFYQVSSSDLISTWSGQSEKLIRELFDHALSYTCGTAVIFVDEIDSLCRIRSRAEDESSRRVKTELLVQIQRLHNSRNSILFICATNCPWDLDSAFLRRFEKRIFVGLPELQSRIQLLQKFLSKTKIATDVNWNAIAEATEGYSGDDLRRLAREVAFHQFRKHKESFVSQQLECATMSQAERIPVTSVDFDEVLQSFSPSVSQVSIQQYDKYKS